MTYTHVVATIYVACVTHLKYNHKRALDIVILE